MDYHSIRTIRHFCLALAGIFLSCLAAAQGIPDDRNINVIGVNPPAGGVPDTGLKQQNEAACSNKPAFPLHIICVFNDYRGVDNPAIGDAWEGWSWSINGGQTWFSDLLPGHPGDTPNVGFEFAADPQVAAAPGVVLVSYIAADRGDNAPGALFLHRLFEVNREAGAPWAAEMLPKIVSSGNAGQFVDKPFQLLHLAPPGSGNVRVSSTLKDGSAISQDVPAGRLFVAYTTFLKNKSKLMVARSDDYGESWKETMISQTQAINQSASLAASGDDVCAVWRRFERKKQSDAILVACSKNRGKKWSKSTEVSAEPEFFPYDQATTENTFRVNSHPVIASLDGTFYAFWSSRAGTSPFFARIVYSISTDSGSSWSAPVKVDDAALGHQYQPTVAVARGTLQLAWSDTRNDPFQGVFINDVLGDEIDPSDDNKVIRHQGDMRTIQIIGGVLSPNSVQVSKYLHGARSDTPTGILEQLEFNFLNDRLFKIGSVPFNGDFPHIAAPLFRLEEGEWVSNASVGDSVVAVDFLVTWTDNRDVRGNVWMDLADPTVYTPANMTPAMTANGETSTSDPDATPEETTLATLREDAPALSTVTESAVSKIDTARADAEPDPTDTYPVCTPGLPGNFTYSDRSRNQNIYSNLVRPGVSIDSPSASKPTGIVQRAHVIWISNNTDDVATYTVSIDNQPADAPIDGRATFLQVPVAPFDPPPLPPMIAEGLLTEIDVTIDPNSTVARTIFVSSQLTNPPIGVSVSDGGTSAPLGTITLNPDFRTPDIQNPDVQNPDVQNPDIQNAEVHNPDIQNDPVVLSVPNPDVQNPDIQNPDIQNPDVQNPDVQNPDVQNPDIQNPDIQNPDIQNESLDGSSAENPDTAHDDLTSAERANGYTDITWEVQNDGNTTTAFNLDAFVNGDTTGLRTQLIGTRRQVTETSRNCTQLKQVQNQVIFNLLDPDLSLFEENTSAGIFGDGSAYVAPAETILITLRVWGNPNFPVERTGIRVEAQSCNSEDKTPGTTECNPPFEQIGTPNAPPVITVPLSTVFLEAEDFEGDIGAYSEEPVSVTDDFDASIELVCTAEDQEDSGFDLFDMVLFFEFGDTVVTCSATDTGGLTSMESFTVTVEDTTPPVISIQDDGEGDTNFYFTASCSSPGMYNIFYQSYGDDVGGPFQWVTVSDEVDPMPTLSCVPPSGGDQDDFDPPEGGEPSSTEVQCDAFDSSGNNAMQATFNVVVSEAEC